jgi:diaminohydroxyphosphoribosylaminopyrimidine deaminase/5-amino-6-(5-phosphoribosylamino)uracil reductase
MAEALRLARKGMYTCDPNPRVGCVIADEQRVLGRGWHASAGGAHAEIEALRDANDPVSGKTAYVTLEPCAHHGRTPPCTEALIDAGIRRVVIAGNDPNPQVSGNGVEILREAGISVESGLMSTEAEALNPGFLSRMRKGRPWVRVKIAISLDGRTALEGGDSKWISSEESRQDVQRWRARSSAILTGIGTVLADDPQMTARVNQQVRQPLRVIADSRWRTPLDSRILSDPDGTLVAGSRLQTVSTALESAGISCLSLPEKDGRLDLAALLSKLADREINEVQVEAGARLNGALLTAGLIDEMLIYQAPVLLGDQAAGPFAFGPLESMTERTHLKLLETTRFGDDLRIRLQPREHS